MTLSVNGLTFGYGKTPVLKDVGFSADRGEVLAVLGPNGAGKTTLFRCILGEQKQYAGSIQIDGVEAKTLSSRNLAHHVAYIPQTHPMTFRFTVRDMVLMGTTHRISPLSVPRAREERAAEDAMKQLGIETLAEKDFDRISGGEQQLVYIARALAQQAKILVMDEPTASLDYGNQFYVLSVVRALAREGYTVLVSTHNPQHAIWYSDRVLALVNGRVAAFGASRETLTPVLIEMLYGRHVSLEQTNSGPVIVPTPEELQK